MGGVSVLCVPDAFIEATTQSRFVVTRSLLDNYVLLLHGNATFAVAAGESIAECAVREVFEETGIRIRNRPQPESEGFSPDLWHPTPFAGVDSIVRDEAGAVQFHYAIIDVSECFIFTSVYAWVNVALPNMTWRVNVVQRTTLATQLQRGATACS